MTPAAPIRSPSVTVAGEIETHVAGRAGGPALEARIHAPAGALRTVVLCHPHPVHGGSMHSPVPLVIAKLLSEVARDRVAWVRFNYRGVGSSEGAYDGGRGEVEDVRAVLDDIRVRVPGAPTTVCGHSFGSWVGLRAATSDGQIERILLIAPSTRLFDFEDLTHAERRSAMHKTIFIGDRDEFCSVQDARSLAEELGADVRVFEGYDHHFLKSRRALADSSLPVIAPEVAVP
jgi:alpha/beta superfamily hydrolase